MARGFGGFFLRSLALLAASPGPAAEPVVVNFGVPSDPPLVRKFGFANSCTVPVSRYVRDAPALAALRPDTVRVELGLGKPGAGWLTPVVGGTPGNLQYSWDELDTLVTVLRTNGIWPIISHSYTPVVLQREDWNFPPPSLRQWAGCGRELAYHYRTSGVRLGGHEIWSSPDLTTFFNASRGIYCQLVKQTVLALREGDPDAVIGAPAIAERAEWVVPFLGFVEFEKLPLDFFAFQAVAPGGAEQTWGPATNRLLDIRKALVASPRLATTEIRLSAFNPLPSAQCRPGGAVDQPALATTVLEAMAQFLGENDLTAVNWASLMDAGGKQETLGLLDEAGNPRPAFGAFAFYADMPVDRRQAAAPAPLRVLASADAGRACAVVWNPSGSSQAARVQLDALPFAGGQLKIHQLDAGHSLGLNRSNIWSLVPQETQPFDGTNVAWAGELPAGGVVYLKAELRTAPVAPAAPPSAQLVRLHRYFPERGKSNYADFNRADWTARLGMGSEDRSVSMIGVNLANCPTNLLVKVQTSGSPRKLDKDSVLAVRVDIFDRNSFTKSLLFHAGLYDPTRDGRIPWGTYKAPDQVVKVGADQPWSIDLAGLTSPYWGRRAIVTFILQNAGNGARAKFTLSSRR
jgi:hypothetical protein